MIPAFALTENVKCYFLSLRYAEMYSQSFFIAHGRGLMICNVIFKWTVIMFDIVLMTQFVL